MPNILYKIDNQYPYFTKNEKKIAQFILNYPHKVVNMTSQEIANQLETLSLIHISEPT
ncbi:MAG: MurR/RpiR family transcriptional regulator, partial [Staphylococcus epidermidis]|nr:MurR/RpiR family transcriptional regulator [Staphylococcus epidermidis]